MAKSTKWHRRQAKTQISLGIRPVCQSLRFALNGWLRAQVFFHADSEDWSDWADAQADLSLRWAHMLFCWFCREAAHVTHSAAYPTSPPSSQWKATIDSRTLNKWAFLTLCGLRIPDFVVLLIQSYVSAPLKMNFFSHINTWHPLNACL